MPDTNPVDAKAPISVVIVPTAHARVILTIFDTGAPMTAETANIALVRAGFEDLNAGDLDASERQIG